MKNVKSNIIEKYAINFNENARLNKYDPVFYRNIEIKKIIETLCRRNKNNVVLLGFPGVGKTAIVESIAQMIIKNEVPDILKNKKLYGLKISTLLAGTSYRGEFEERVEFLLKEICNSEVILFIDEFHTIVKAGASEGSVDFVNIIKPYISRGDIQLIGATTFSEYENSIFLDKALDRRFHKIKIEEPNIFINYLIIKKLKYKYEQFYKIRISDNSILEAINLTKNIKDSYFPDKALDLIDLACSSLIMYNEFMYSDELIELEYREDFHNNLIIDPLFKNIYKSKNHIDIDVLKIRRRKLIQVFETNNKKFTEQKEKMQLLNSYIKEANSMKNQGYISKSNEILDVIVPEIVKKLDKNKVELTKEFVNLFYNKSYGR